MANPPGAGHDDSGLNLKYAKAKLFLTEFKGLAADGTSLGAGGQIAELAAASELAGVSAATNDEFYTMVDLANQFDFDLVQDVQARVGFVQPNADSGIIFTLNIKGVAANEAFGDAASSPDGQAVFSAQTVVGGELKVTEWKALGVANEMVDDLVQQIELILTDSGTASADEIKIAFVELRGHRKITNDSGRQST